MLSDIDATKRGVWLLGLVVLFLSVSCTDAVPSNDAQAQDTTSTTDLATTTPPSSSPATAASVAPSTTSLPPPQIPASLDDYRLLWEQERAAIIDELTTDAYGLGADGVLRGPGNFAVDTTDCPADWADDEGVIDGTIMVVQLAPLSALTTIADLGLGAQTYFNRLNANGGIGPDGLLVDFQVVDDAFVPEKTKQIVDELLAGTQPLAISTLGTLTLDAVNELVNEHCVPLLMGISSSPIWADPGGRPWTTGLQMAQTTEAGLWEQWIVNNVNRPVSVAAVVMDNSFGRTYENAFSEAIADNELIERFDVVHHDPAAPDLTDEMVQIVDLQPDVFISMTGGNPCLLAIQEAARQNLAASTTIRFTPSVCAESNAYMEPAGLDGDGWLIAGGGIKDSTSDQWADDPWITFVDSEIRAAGGDPTYGRQVKGFGLRGWALHQTLEIAANLDGGLTRSNLILTQRGLGGMTHPMLYPGVRFAMNGNQDPYFIEGSEVSTYDADAHRWVSGEVIDINGETPPCAWQVETGSCDTD